MSKDFAEYGKIALGVSGGRDSMVMLDMFSKSGTDFFVVTVDHGIRGKDSSDDADFVAEFCKSRGIICRKFAVDAPAYAKANKIGLEQAARELRHNIYKSFIDIGEADKIALAHHADDAAESVLMHILRGCGLDGLRGMSEEDGYIIRPLIAMRGAQIADYAEKYRVPYREDATNADTSYSRNFLRLAVIPLIKQKYPSFERSLSRLSETAEKVCEFLDGFASGGIRKTDDAVLIPCADLSRGDIIDDVNLKRALELFGADIDFESKHYEAVKALCASENGAKIDLPRGYFAAKEYEFIAIRKKVEPENRICKFGFGNIGFGNYGIQIERVGKMEIDRNRKPRVLFFDADKLPAGAVIRYCAEGDRFKPFGGGTKSLGDYFTDKKIPLATRRTLPVLADGNRILAVLGAEISDDLKCGAECENICALKVTEKKGYE